jgi:uncharacterized protein
VNLLRRARWSPYVVGACIGILSWFTFAWMGHAIGVSSTAVHVAGGLESTVVPEHVTQNAYFTETFGGEALINWEFMLVVMLFVGAWLASRLGGAPRPEHVPELWAWRFGPSRPLRYTFAFVGGAILMFGASCRWVHKRAWDIGDAATGGSVVDIHAAYLRHGDDHRFPGFWT